jgi:hypothetical protein
MAGSEKLCQKHRGFNPIDSVKGAGYETEALILAISENTWYCVKWLDEDGTNIQGVPRRVPHKLRPMSTLIYDN